MFIKIKKEETPVTIEAPGTTMRALLKYGDMTVAFNDIPAGTDPSPLFQYCKKIVVK